MPHHKPILQYSNGQFQFKVPFVMYADFESILEPIQGPSNNPRASSTRGVNVHTPSGWCILSRFAYGEDKNNLMSYRGKDCISKFCKHIVAEARHLYSSFPELPMEPLPKSQVKNTIKLGNATFASDHLNRKIGRLGIIATILVNIEELHTPYAICSIRYRITSQWYSIILLDMMHACSYENYQNMDPAWE